jgi:hypothetical protein
MREFIEERARLIRSLADKADPSTRLRLLTLAEKYETRVGDGVDGNSQQVKLPKMPKLPLDYPLPVSSER